METVLIWKPGSVVRMIDGRVLTIKEFVNTGFTVIEDAGLYERKNVMEIISW